MSLSIPIEFLDILKTHAYKFFLGFVNTGIDKKGIIILPKSWIKYPKTIQKLRNYENVYALYFYSILMCTFTIVIEITENNTVDISRLNN